MAVERATSTIKVELDTLLFYRKSGVGIIGGKLLDPIISNGKIFCKEGELCNIKFRSDIIDFSRISNVKILEIIIGNTYEEKCYKETLIKQFTAKSITEYKSDTKKSMTF